MFVTVATPSTVPEIHSKMASSTESPPHPLSLAKRMITEVPKASPQKRNLNNHPKCVGQNFDSHDLQAMVLHLCMLHYIIRGTLQMELK